MTNHRGATRHDILPGGRYPGQDLYDVMTARAERAEAEIERLRAAFDKEVRDSQSAAERLQAELEDTKNYIGSLRCEIELTHRVVWEERCLRAEALIVGWEERALRAEEALADAEARACRGTAVPAPGGGKADRSRLSDMAEGRTICKHYHTGWMIQRLQYDKRRGTEYLCWRCRECERISNLAVSRKRRAKKRAQLGQGD